MKYTVLFCTVMFAIGLVFIMGTKVHAVENLINWCLIWNIHLLLSQHQTQLT